MSLQNRVTLTKGVDYFVEYNSAFNVMTLRIPNASSITAANGKPAAFRVEYDSTSPANGTSIRNAATMVADGTPKKVREDLAEMVGYQIRNSVHAEGGNIKIEIGYRIVLYKVDAKTGRRLQGAEFTITAPDGSTETIVSNASGEALSKLYPEAVASLGKFTVEI